MRSTNPLSGQAAIALDTRRWAWLPAVGTPAYYTLLAFVGMCLLGPLGGVTAAYMNFSLGFYVGGQVLAGILGSVITYGYGAEGRHGANYIQTIAASVASMMAMSTLLQSLAWLGITDIAWWKLVAFMTCTGMMAAGVGMLMTPILVERMQLPFPSGWAVANILRALTDPVLLRQSVSRLFGGMASGFAVGLASAKVAAVGVLELSAATFGAGMIVGARIGLAALTGGLVFWALTPVLIDIGWLKPGEPFRKIAFLISLGMVLGASLIDLIVIARDAMKRLRESAPAAASRSDARSGRLIAWVVCWSAITCAAGHLLFGVPIGFMVLGVAMVFVFVLICGICTGLTDSPPISAAFVVTVLVLATLGLHDIKLAFIVAAMVLMSANTAGDMQQDRSTGWRLGSSRTLQFRFQVGGLVAGASRAVAIAQLFMNAYPVLRLDQTTMIAADAPAQWTSAMTFKLVGVLRSLTEPQPHQITAIWLGLGIGLAVELARKLIKANPRYRRWSTQSKAGARTDFILDAVLLPSPYAFSFGGFVNLMTSFWLAAGSAIATAYEAWKRKHQAQQSGEAAMPSDMSATSLVGGGIIAGDALAALTLGVIGLVTTL